MIYPLHLQTQDPEKFPLLLKSLDHWYSLNSSFRYPGINIFTTIPPSAHFRLFCSPLPLSLFFRGHSWTAAASMSALLGRPDAALTNITFFINGGCEYPNTIGFHHLIFVTYLRMTAMCGLGPNTLYWEEKEQCNFPFVCKCLLM